MRLKGKLRQKHCPDTKNPKHYTVFAGVWQVLNSLSENLPQRQKLMLPTEVISSEIITHPSASLFFLLNNSVLHDEVRTIVKNEKELSLS